MPIIKFFKKLLKTPHQMPIDLASKHLVRRQKHRVSKSEISVNALQVINQLGHHGYEAYLVGGSVSDLILRKVPKDFDVATNATPQQIKKLFKNARIIGRRFKLVHITFHREIIEVSTFRSNQPDEDVQTNDQGMVIRDNVFGSLEQDSWRRDFTINSMYYNIFNGSIVDYTSGFEDMLDKNIRVIGDPKKRYQEDPVRMLRAIRFAAKLEFNIEKESSNPIHSLADLLLNVSNARLFDEISKLWSSEAALPAFHLLIKYNIFGKLFPWTQASLEKHANAQKFIEMALENTDSRLKEQKPITPAFIFAVLMWFPMRDLAERFQEEQQLHPLEALEQAMSQIFSSQGRIIGIPRRYTQLIREIWILQYRFHKRIANKPFILMEHARFRAAYDFLLLRALADDETVDLANWWTLFQDAAESTQEEMIAALMTRTTSPKKKRRRRPKKTISEEGQTSE
jgi:poly(A) polymerase